MNNRIRELCKEKGVTPYRMAKDLGFPLTAVYHYMSGKRNPSVKRSMEIAKYLNKSVEDLWT